MYMVYWTEPATGVGAVAETEAGAGTTAAATAPRQLLFAADQLLAAMALMEQLRTRQRAGEGIRFVTMSAENPDSIGHDGVDVTGPGYGWTKRRHRF